MVAPLVFIEVIENPPIELVRREHGRVMTVVHRTMAETWTTRHLPKHFTPAARSLYGHQPRTAATVRRKRQAAARGQAELGGNVDNVWTGLAMRSILGVQKIRANSRQSTASMVAPRYFYAYKPGQPNKARETTTVADVEQVEIAAAASAAYPDAVKQVVEGRSRTTKIKG